MLEIRNLGFSVDGETHIHPSDLRLERGVFNVLLGPTLAGKTTLLRLLAGLEKPSEGDVLLDGESIKRQTAKQRRVAFVYQQFINYPNLTVAGNIASPLVADKVPRTEIEAEVQRISKLLKIDPFLERLPQELSGGQQQRVAIGRALAKRSRLILMDEPLANLDYKLREELREEMPKLLEKTESVILYTTTEPREALLLPGRLTTLHEGRILDSGTTRRLFDRPANLNCAKTCSYPPLNTVSLKYSNGALVKDDFSVAPRTGSGFEEGERYTLAIRPYRLGLAKEGETETTTDRIRFRAKVLFTELAGSDSYVHLKAFDRDWVMHRHRPVDFAMNSELYLETAFEHCLFFKADGSFLDGEGGRHG